MESSIATKAITKYTQYTRKSPCCNHWILAEAEQELQEGPLTEYSGPALALLKAGDRKSVV